MIEVSQDELHQLWSELGLIVIDLGRNAREESVKARIQSVRHKIRRLEKRLPSHKL